MNIAVFVSGRGTNLEAILNSEELKDKVKIKAVVSNLNDCGAFRIAENFSIPIYVVNKVSGVKFKDLTVVFDKEKIELVVLAGYLKLIPVDFLEKFKNRIINIHPALLPSFGGKGMYGLNVHLEVFRSSAKVSGASVHFVDNEYDKGKIIAQKCVDISDVKSPEEIAERVLKVEHYLLPYVIGKFADNKITFVDDRVIVL